MDQQSDNARGIHLVAGMETIPKGLRSFTEEI